MTTPVLEMCSLTKSFDQEEVLRGIDCQIESGQVVGLVGTNGSGKTTLIKCLLGLLRCSSGACRVLGEDGWDLSAGAKARLGYVSQDFELLPWMTVRQICDDTGAFYDRWQAPDVAKWIEHWKLPPEKRTGALSVGQ